MDDQEWEAGLWTETTRADFVRTAESAIAALQAYVAMVAAASSGADEPMIDRAERAVRARLVAMSDAELAYSSTAGPCGELTPDDELDGDEVEGEGAVDDAAVDPPAEHDQVSVLVRQDFRVISQAAVLEAGRAAYRAVWPQVPAEAAAVDVSHLGRAIYQIMHSGGLEALTDVPGLQPVAGVALAVGLEELLSQADLDQGLQDPAALFDLGGATLHMQADIWG